MTDDQVIRLYLPRFTVSQIQDDFSTEVLGDNAIVMIGELIKELRYMAIKTGGGRVCRERKRI